MKDLNFYKIKFVDKPFAKIYSFIGDLNEENRRT